LDELLHYRTLSNRLVEDTREWGREFVVVIGGIVIAVTCALALYLAAAGVH
jgi:methylmalonyl-CoA mutase cobalamin-binding subunit